MSGIVLHGNLILPKLSKGFLDMDSIKRRIRFE